MDNLFWGEASFFTYKNVFLGNINVIAFLIFLDSGKILTQESLVIESIIFWHGASAGGCVRILMLIHWKFGFWPRPPQQKMKFVLNFLTRDFEKKNRNIC